MTKAKSNRSTINQNNNINITYENLSKQRQHSVIFLFELMQRLLRTMWALEAKKGVQYGNIPFYGEGFNWLRNEAKAALLAGHDLSIPVLNDYNFPFSAQEKPEDIFSFIRENINPLNIQNEENLTLCFLCCMALMTLNDKNCKMTDEENFTYFIQEHFITVTSYETIGYWTKALEEKKKGKDKVRSRTVKKEERKIEMKEWMKTMKIKDCRIMAMQKWGVTERTILLYEQELKDEIK